mgnify:CR=1 FL=1
MSTPAAAPEDLASEPQSSLANRYGRPKRRMSKRTTLILASVGVLALILGVLFLSQRGARSYEPTDVAFDIVSPRLMHVTVAVSMKEGDSITCGVQALSEDKAVVGYAEQVFDGATDGQSIGAGRVVVQHKVTLRTTFIAVSGGTSACWPTQQ